MLRSVSVDVEVGHDGFYVSIPVTAKITVAALKEQVLNFVRDRLYEAEQNDVIQTNKPSFMVKVNAAKVI